MPDRSHDSMSEIVLPLDVHPLTGETPTVIRYRDGMTGYPLTDAEQERDRREIEEAEFVRRSHDALSEFWANVVRDDTTD